MSNYLRNRNLQTHQLFYEYEMKRNEHTLWNELEIRFIRFLSFLCQIMNETNARNLSVASSGLKYRSYFIHMRYCDIVAISGK